MKKQILTAIIVLSASVSYGQSLVQFQNGTVADADDVNANFSSLETQITANATATSNITSSPWESVGVDIFYTDGAVGIGTNTPNAILEVQGNTLFSNSGAVADDFVFQTITDNDVNLRLKAAVGTGNESVWGITAASDTGEFGIRRIGLASVNDLTISSSGNVGIGVSTPSATLEVKGQTIFSSSGPVVEDFIFETTSDNDVNIRLKVNSGSVNETVWGIQADTSGFFSIGKVGETELAFRITDNGYIQLATITASPNVDDCDETDEFGRMKIDHINSLLFICTQAGWVGK